MKGFSIFLFMLMLLAGIAYFTKPSDKKCIQQARVEVKSQISGDVNSNNAVVSNVLDHVVERAVRVEDKVLYKSISYSFGGTRRQIGWGAFGMVNIVAQN